MILDKGKVKIYSISNTASAGNLPNATLALIGEYWYGELNFETAPRNLNQEYVEVSQKIRILQNRAIQNHNVAIIGTAQYDILRAYHGTDDESGEAISDLSLERLVQAYAL